MDENRIRIFWYGLKVLLQSGRDMLAYEFFAVIMQHVFALGLKSASVDILLKIRVAAAFDKTITLQSRIDKAWGVILMAYKHGHLDLSTSCFEEAITETYQHGIELIHYLAKDGEPAVLSIHYW